MYNKRLAEEVLEIIKDEVATNSIIDRNIADNGEHNTI